MRTEHQPSSKLLAILVVASMTSLLLASALVEFAGSAQDEVLLSGEGNLAANPRADMSDDGTYLAVVWVEGEETSEYRGDILLRRATWNAGQSTYDWDANPVTVFDATGEGYLYADIDIQGNIAHVAAAYQNGSFVRIAYNQCDLANPTPSFGTDGQTVILVFDNQNAYVLSSIQVTASGDPNKPYITFGRNDGKIYYVRWDTSNSNPISSPDPVSEDDAYKVQMAYTSGTDDNYVHFLWEKRLEDGNTGYPLYRRCQESTGACSDPVKLEHQDTIGSTYPSPFLTAQGECLIAGWQRCTQGGGSGTYCQRFGMMYARSDDAGQSLVDLGADEYPGVPFGDPAGYPGTDNTNKIYRSRLQPSIDLNNEGHPYVAWQISTDAHNEQHAITTTLAISETDTGFIWAQLPGLEISSSRDYVKPFALVPHADKDPGQSSGLQGLHLFYMRGSARADPGYGVYYTYLQEIDPNAPTPTDDPTGEPTGEPTDEPADNKIFLPMVMRGHGGE